MSHLRRQVALLFCSHALYVERGAFQQARLEGKVSDTGVFEIHSVLIHQEILPYLIGPMAKWI